MLQLSWLPPRLPFALAGNYLTTAVIVHNSSEVMDAKRSVVGRPRFDVVPVTSVLIVQLGEHGSISSLEGGRQHIKWNKSSLFSFSFFCTDKLLQGTCFKYSQSRQTEGLNVVLLQKCFQEFESTLLEPEATHLRKATLLIYQCNNVHWLGC